MLGSHARGGITPTSGEPCSLHNTGSRCDEGESIEPTASALALKSLLSGWPRQTVARQLFSFSDPQSALLDGSVAASLRQLARPRRSEAGAGAGASARSRARARAWADDGAAVCILDEAFPTALRDIPDPPLLLYWRGDLQAARVPGVAVVGARRCTAAGRQFATQLGADLAHRGIVVVSGLALGIDGAAQNGVVQAGGVTVAVLGSGLRQLYPAANRALAERLLDAGGLVLSEYPPDMPPARWHFPERNRIVSGLAVATVVVEAGDRSGSLITARMALEQGRDVYAVPGPPGSAVSRGCHRLIRQGAGLVTGANDVLAELGLEVSTPAASVAPRLGQRAQRILQALAGGRLGTDELMLETGCGAAELAAEMTSLELEGFVRRVADGYIATS